MLRIRQVGTHPTRLDLVVRGDGTLVEIQSALGPREEFHQFIKLFKDWRMLALLYVFFA